MPITDIPIFSMLRTRMQWHQERQLVLAENIANADTPNYHARDLVPPSFDSALQTASLTLMRTDPGSCRHEWRGFGSSPRTERQHYEIRPRGNAVSHEEEMLKLAGNQLDYDAVTSLYTHSIALIKTAIGRS